MFAKYATFTLCILCIIQQYISLLYSFPSDETIFTEISMCAINKLTFLGVDPFSHGCEDLKQRHQEGENVYPSFSTLINRKTLTPKLKYTGYLIGNASLLSGKVDLQGTISMNGNILSELKTNFETETKSADVSVSTHQELRRRRLLKGGGSSWGGRKSTGSSQSYKPNNIRQSSGNAFHRRYRRRSYFSRRRFSTHRRHGYSSAGTGYGTFDTTRENEEQTPTDLSLPFYANVKSWRRLPNDLGGVLCESTDAGCARLMEDMTRIPITEEAEISVDTNLDELQLDFSFLKIQTEAPNMKNAMLYVMFVTNEIPSGAATINFYLLSYLPVIVCLIALCLHPKLHLYTAKDKEMLLWKPTNVSDTMWSVLQLPYYGILLMYVASFNFFDSFPFLTDDPCRFVLLITIVSIGLKQYQKYTYEKAAVQRHVLLPWCNQTHNKAFELNADQRWQYISNLINVTSMTQAVEIYNNHCEHRTTTVMIEFEDNDIRAWSNEASLSFGNVKYLNLISNDLTSCSALSHLSCIEMIDLHNNDIVNLYNVSSRTLKWLRISNNNISSIGKRFGPLPKLEYLDLSSNELTTLDGILTSSQMTSVVPNLIALDLSNNSLNGIKRLMQVKTLEAINLDDNDLEDVNELIEIINGLPNLKYVSLENNDINDEDEMRLEGCCEELGIKIDI